MFHIPIDCFYLILILISNNIININIIYFNILFYLIILSLLFVIIIDFFCLCLIA